MKSFVLGFIFSLWVNYTLVAQSNQSDLSALRSYIHQQDSARQERINKIYGQARLSADGMLITDVKPNGHPIYRAPLNINASLTTGASKLQSGIAGLNLEGSGLTLGVWDAGKVQNHVELSGRIISNEGNAFHDHATHVAGTLAASGINPNAKGMAPKAHIAAWYFDNDEAEMAAQAQPDETSLLFSNHSYGQATGWSGANWTGDPAISADEDFEFGFYGEHAQVIDKIAALAPYYTIVWAAGNDRAEKGNGTHPPDCNKGTGYDCIIPDAVGKNIITVGGVNKVLNYINAGSVQMGYYSSWGPTDDGRIKPDLVGDGTDVFSSTATGNNTYAVFGGTSMATPNVTGSLSLLQELYARLHGGKKMKAATLKALAIHTAKEAGNFPGPDYSFGWGLLDVEAGAKVLLHENDVDIAVKELSLNEGETMEIVLTPKSNQKITTTIVWTDVPGTPVPDKLDPADKMLVNDLDIKIVDEEGNEFLPWVLNPGLPAQAATKGVNSVDNVEKIEFEFPAEKNYRLVVNHKNKLAGGKQDFALIITYQSSTTAGQTFYWIGDTGNWNDPSHWSLTSGGISSNKIPTANDHVIVDENSFDGSGADQINFIQDQSISNLLWIRLKPSGISLNNNNLTIGNSLTIGSQNFHVYSAGNINCSTSSNGKINLNKTTLDLATLTINGGNWMLRGQTDFNKLIVDNGNLEINHSKFKIQNLIINSAKDKTLKLTKSEITLSGTSQISQTNLSLSSSDSFLKTSGDVLLDWQNVLWPANLLVEAGKLTISGNNSIKKMEVNGSIQLNGSNKMDSLIVNAGATVTLAAASNQTIGDINFKSLPTQPIIINGDQNSALTLSVHKKYCYNHLQITNAEAKGVAVINAGENSVINNSKGWLSQKCEDVLFADFAIKYPCENGLTRFTDKSQGKVKQWTWTFPEGATVQANEADFSFSKSGTYQVQLSVSDGTAINSYSGEVNVVANTLASNEVIIGSEELFSLNQASNYQWMKNNSAISAEKNRSFSYKGEDGVYAVITYDQTCNRISDKATVTGLKDLSDKDLSNVNIKIYPNPVSEEISIEHNENTLNIIITDLLGRIVLMKNVIDKKSKIPVSELSNGYYLLKAKSKHNSQVQKILIQHQ